MLPALGICMNETASPWLPPAVFKCKAPKSVPVPPTPPPPTCKDFKDEAGCEGDGCEWCQ